MQVKRKRRQAKNTDVRFGVDFVAKVGYSRWMPVSYSTKGDRL
jgi:hypothetical protein